MAKTIKAQADELREKVDLLEGPDEGTVIKSLMQVLAGEPVRRAEVAVVFEPFKS